MTKSHIESHSIASLGQIISNSKIYDNIHLSSPNKPWWIKPSNQNPDSYYFQPYCVSLQKCIKLCTLCTLHMPFISSTWMEKQHKYDQSRKSCSDSSRPWDTDLGLDRNVIQQTPQWPEPDSRLGYTHTHTHDPQHINVNLCYLSILPYVFI